VDGPVIACVAVITAFATALAWFGRTPRKPPREAPPTPRRPVIPVRVPRPPAAPPAAPPLVEVPPRAQVVEGGQQPRAPGERMEQAARSAGTLLMAIGTLAFVGVLAIAATIVVLLVVLYCLLHGAKGLG
jgi:hypothetical protein